jgi:CheY-like chemotaxis protein
MTGKIVLVAHRTAAVRERFAAALAEAGHRPMPVESAAEVRAAIDEAGGRLDLALVDAALPHDVVAAIVGAAAPADDRPVLVVFASTVSGAAQVRALAASGVRAYVNDFGAPSQILASLAPYLFHDRFNRRAGPRIPVAMGVSCRLDGRVSSATALNIGRGGIALRTLAPVAAGTTMWLSFRLPTAARDLEVEVRVCWTSTQLTLGAQFEHIAPADQAAVDAFVEQHLQD